MKILEPDKLLWVSMTNMISLVMMQLRTMALAAEGNDELIGITSMKIDTLKSFLAQMQKDVAVLEDLLWSSVDDSDIAAWLEGE